MYAILFLIVSTLVVTATTSNAIVPRVSDHRSIISNLKNDRSKLISNSRNGLQFAGHPLSVNRLLFDSDSSDELNNNHNNNTDHGQDEEYYLNTSVDYVLERINRYIKEQLGADSFWLPGVHFSNSIYEVFVNNGTFSDLSSWQRTGNAFGIIHPNGILNVTIPLKLAKLNLAFEKYRLRFQHSIINEGHVSVNVSNTSVLLKLNVDLTKCRVDLRQTILIQKPRVQVHLSGLSMFSQWILNSAVDRVMTYCETYFANKSTTTSLSWITTELQTRLLEELLNGVGLCG